MVSLNHMVRSSGEHSHLTVRSPPRSTLSLCGFLHLKLFKGFTSTLKAEFIICLHTLSWAGYLFRVYVSHIFATLVENNFEAFDFSFYLLTIQAHLMALSYELHFCNCLQKHTAGLLSLIEY